MKIEIEPGETLLVTLAGTDGEFRITFGEDALTVETDMPDDDDRQGVIYRETFGELWKEHREKDAHAKDVGQLIHLEEQAYQDASAGRITWDEYKAARKAKEEGLAAYRAEQAAFVGEHDHGCP